MTESIDTAPKDGTKILCDCSDGKKRYCWWFGCSDVDGFWMTQEEAEPVAWYPAKSLPPSLKEQALDLLDRAEWNTMTENLGNEKAFGLKEVEIIRRALEALDD